MAPARQIISKQGKNPMQINWPFLLFVVLPIAATSGSVWTYSIVRYLDIDVQIKHPILNLTVNQLYQLISKREDWLRVNIITGLIFWAMVIMVGFGFVMSSIVIP